MRMKTPGHEDETGHVLTKHKGSLSPLYVSGFHHSRTSLDRSVHPLPLPLPSLYKSNGISKIRKQSATEQETNGAEAFL